MFPNHYSAAVHSIFRQSRNNAFSLIELSIVLVILGLLTGGILAGRSLIRASELRAVSTEVQRYRSAIYGFRDKYFSLPGDMNNATSFWGSAGGTGSNLACFQSAASTNPRTCNGDGDGKIEGIYDDGTYATYAFEGMRAWQQLANAGMIEGSYDGVAYSTARFGTNSPASKMSKGGYSLLYADGLNFSIRNDSELSNYLLFGAASDVANGVILSPEEAWNIDTKMDDGTPAVGSVLSDPDQLSCVTGTPATYALSTSGAQCSLRFRLR